jgi:hypothetical protein
MDIPGTGYLYTVAVVATTFAGFAVLIMVFRQMMGGKVTKLDSFATRSFVQLSFMSTGGSLLPPLLALFPLSLAFDWRAASAVMAVILGLWAVAFPHRRHAASKVPAPWPIYCVNGMFIITAIALAADVVFAPPALTVGIYAAAMTIILAGGAIFFMLALIYLVERPIEQTQPHPEAFDG